MHPLIVRHYQDNLDYLTTWQKMVTFTVNRTKTPVIDEIWLLEHNPVFTIGYNGTLENLLKKTDIPIIHSDRGGEITYHGDGQLICYLLMDLNKLKISVHKFISIIEKSIIAALGKDSIKSYTKNNLPGVYIDNQKICSLGLRIKHGYSYHGFALNIQMDLTPFSYINPCGEKNLKITQLTNYTKNKIIAPSIIEHLAKELNYTDLKYINC